MVFSVSLLDWGLILLYIWFSNLSRCDSNIIENMRIGISNYVIKFSWMVCIKLLVESRYWMQRDTSFDLCASYTFSFVVSCCSVCFGHHCNFVSD